MKPIVSAGAVIYRRELNGVIKFLLMYHGRNYWNFPKGRLESGEGAIAAFLREVEEETGLKRNDLEILSGFQATDRYFLTEPAPVGLPGHGNGRANQRRSVLKIVIYYLVRTRKREVVVSHEHEGFAWFDYREALHIAKYKNTQAILKRAHEFIQENLRRHPAHPPRAGRHLR